MQGSHQLMCIWQVDENSPSNMMPGVPASSLKLTPSSSQEEFGALIIPMCMAFHKPMLTGKKIHWFSVPEPKIKGACWEYDQTRIIAYCYNFKNVGVLTLPYPALSILSRYSASGEFEKELPSLLQGRSHHACSSYKDDNGKRVSSHIFCNLDP